MADIVVVTRTIYAPLFEKFKEVHPKLRFELATTDGEGGSADALRGIQSKIKVRAAWRAWCRGQGRAHAAAVAPQRPRPLVA